MLNCKRHFRFAAWLATFAMLLGALAPAVSQAMTVFGDGSARWIEVCTHSGMQWVTVTSDDTERNDGAPAPTVSTATCAYCCPHAGSVGLPPTVSMNFSVSGAPALEPLLFLSAPIPLFAWTVSSPRAPPSAS